MQRACPACARALVGSPPSPPVCVCGASLPPRDLAGVLDEIGPPLPTARGALPFGGGIATGDRPSDTISVTINTRKA